MLEKKLYRVKIVKEAEYLIEAFDEDDARDRAEVYLYERDPDVCEIKRENSILSQNN